MTQIQNTREGNIAWLLDSHNPVELNIVRQAGSYRGSCNNTFHGEGYKLKVIDKSSGRVVGEFPREILKISDSVANALRDGEIVDGSVGKVLMKYHGHYGFFPRGYPDFVVALRVYARDAPKRHPIEE